MILWLFENSRDLMHVIGADGRFKLTNPAWKQLTGWEEGDLLGEPAIAFFHPDDVAGVRARVAALTPGGVSESQVRVRLRSGDHCWFRSEEHTSELQSLMRISYAGFCLK